MKTQIALLVTVITSIPFWGGCASTELTDVKTYKLSELATNDGVWHNKLSNSRKPITCRVVKWIDGELQTEFFLKDGLKNGRFRDWHVDGGKVKKGLLRVDAVYENGIPVRYKEFSHGPRAGLYKDDKNYQKKVPGWNKDGTPGTPTDPSEEK